jgi:hypothetical protein
MPSLTDVASGVAGGAMAGNAIIPGLGGLVGAGAGFLGSLFGKSAGEKRRESYDETMSLINSLKAETERRRQAELKTGVRTLGRYGQSMISSARSGAASRMAALGRGGETESAVLPAEQGAAGIANRNMTGFVEGTNARFNQEQAGLDQDKVRAQFQYNATENEPSVGQEILGIGSAVGQLGQSMSYIDALKDYTGNAGGENGRVLDRPSLAKTPTAPGPGFAARPASSGFMSASDVANATSTNVAQRGLIPALTTRGAWQMPKPMSTLEYGRSPYPKRSIEY